MVSFFTPSVFSLASEPVSSAAAKRKVAAKVLPKKATKVKEVLEVAPVKASTKAPAKTAEKVAPIVVNPPVAPAATPASAPIYASPADDNFQEEDEYMDEGTQQSFQPAGNQQLITLSYSLMNQLKSLARQEGVNADDMILELLTEGLTRRTPQDGARQGPSHLMTRNGYLSNNDANGNGGYTPPTLSHHNQNRRPHNGQGAGNNNNNRNYPKRNNNNNFGGNGFNNNRFKDNKKR